MSTDRWDAGLYDDRHAFVHRMGAGVVELLAPQPGERILDLGCGTGPLTRAIADAGADVLGVDASPAMIEKARASYPNVRFEVADATTMAFDRPFDAIFSNAVLHWVKPPAAAIGRMFAALRPGGRLVLEMGGRGNVAAVLAAIVAAGRDVGVDLSTEVDINYFPSIGEYATLLEAGGFAVELAMLFDRPTPLDGDRGLLDWARMFRPAIFDRVGGRLDDFADRLELHGRGSGLVRDGRWFADYRRLRVKAVTRSHKRAQQADCGN
jgi:trans-aconitate methyltransferase